MKFFGKSILGLLLFATILCSSNPINTLAAEQVEQMRISNGDEESFLSSEVKVYYGINNIEKSALMRSPTITTASLLVTPRSNEILVEVLTACNFTATKVGVSDVLVQEKVWYGWKTIASGSDYELNSTSFSGSTHCTTAQKGKTYRVLCTHYAIESNGTKHTVANQSEEFVYN